MRSYLSIISVLSTIMLLAACEKEPENKEPEKGSPAEINIELQKYYDETGNHNLRSWEDGDRVSFFNTASNSPMVSNGTPVSTGSQSSLFTVPVNAVRNGDIIMAYFPSDADAKGVKDGLLAEIPQVQDGTVNPVYVGTTVYDDASSELTMTMKPFWSTVYVNVAQGSYSITKAVLIPTAGENIAGDVTINADDMSVTATKKSVTVDFKTPLDCRQGSVRFPVLLAPGTMSKGFSVVYSTDDGKSYRSTFEDKITLEMGGRYDVSASAVESTQVLVCGDNMIYLLDADLAVRSGYKNAIIWEWDAKEWYSTVGLTQNNMIRLDDCKPVDDNKKILATSSKGYAVLIDKASGNVLWYSNSSRNAHSGEMLPNGRIAIACSTGTDGNCIQIFDENTSNTVRFSTELESAHGVVWNPVTERLYAVGGKKFNIYQLADWYTSSPRLVLEKSITTSNVSSLHDLTFVDDNTLLLAGNKAVLYDVRHGTFTNIPIFNSSTALKSVNYNVETGECWFTDPTEVEVPDLKWASHTIRYTNDVQNAYQTRSFKVDDLNVYKVRVFNW